jgi:hypothetical protein
VSGTRRRVTYGLAAALALLAVGCRNVETLSYPAPPPTGATTAPTTVGNLTGVATAAVAGGPQAAIAAGPGNASMSGTVSGPNGPVAGADIHAERLVGTQVAAIDAISQADGTWTMPNILGGRYRLRAWRVPDLALTAPQIFFLAGGGDRSIALQLDKFNTVDVATAINPDAPTVGQAAGLAAEITVQSVDANGVVRVRPVAGASVELAGGLSWTVLTANPVPTSPGGRATWQVTCGAPGVQSLAVVVNNTDVYGVDLPACVVPPAPTTTTSTTSPPSTTTTTATPTTTGPGSTTTAP